MTADGTSIGAAWVSDVLVEWPSTKLGPGKRIGPCDQNDTDKESRARAAGEGLTELVQQFVPSHTSAEFQGVGCAA